jgi:DMSO/TMAO reductase YedYZ heme-binding membrane subunit
LPNGWSLVGIAAVVVGALTAIVLGLHGTGEDGMRALLRATARTSLALFLLAYLASTLRALVERPFTRWLIRNRRYVGVSFAVSHLVHGIAIVGLSRATAIPPDPGTLVAGGLAYTVLAALVATSFDRSAAWLGPRAWNRLHRAGIHYLWFVFAFTFAGTLAQAEGAHRIWAALSTAALAGALLLRGVAWHRRRSRAGKRALREGLEGSQEPGI